MMDVAFLKALGTPSEVFREGCKSGFPSGACPESYRAILAAKAWEWVKEPDVSRVQRDAALVFVASVVAYDERRTDGPSGLAGVSMTYKPAGGLPRDISRETPLAFLEELLDGSSRFSPISRRFGEDVRDGILKAPRNIVRTNPHVTGVPSSDESYRDHVEFIKRMRDALESAGSVRRLARSRVESEAIPSGVDEDIQGLFGRTRTRSKPEKLDDALTPNAWAVALRAMHPEWTQDQIARKVGVSARTLRRDSNFRRAEEQRRAGRVDRAKGWKTQGGGVDGATEE
jgi:hypothetical protein